MVEVYQIILKARGSFSLSADRLNWYASDVCDVSVGAMKGKQNLHIIFECHP